MTHIKLHATQTGAVLFMAMIFLVLITIMAVTTFTISKSSSQVVNNISMRKLTQQAATQTSDAAMSTYRMVAFPNSVLYNGTSYTNTVNVDVNGDGKTVIQTQIQAPTCTKGQPKDPLHIDLNDPNLAKCVSSVGVADKCFDITFQVPVVAKELFNSSITGAGAQNSVTQGASVTVNSKGAYNICRSPGGTPYL